MAINDQIRDVKIQYDINREAAKISALSSGKCMSINILLVKKYYHLIKWMIEQVIFTYSPLGFWKTNKNNWRSTRKTSKNN